MPDKKLTDNEIVKALEEAIEYGCGHYIEIEMPTIKNALDLINHLEARIGVYETCNARKDEAIKHLESEVKRLQAENGSLFLENQKFLITMLWGNKKDKKNLLKEIKAEAYKEFAELAVERVEKAKAKYQRLCKEQGEEMEEHMHIHFNGITKIINNLLKELVGEDK